MTNNKTKDMSKAVMRYIYVLIALAAASGAAIFLFADWRQKHNQMADQTLNSYHLNIIYHAANLKNILFQIGNTISNQEIDKDVLGMINPTLGLEELLPSIQRQVGHIAELQEKYGAVELSPAVAELEESFAKFRNRVLEMKDVNQESSIKVKESFDQFLIELKQLERLHSIKRKQFASEMVTVKETYSSIFYTALLSILLIAGIFTSLLMEGIRRVFEKQEESQKLLLQSEEMNRLIMNSVPVLIAYLASDYRYRFANREYKEWLPVKLDDVQGKHVKEVIGEKIFNRIKVYLQEAFSGKEVNFQHILSHPAKGERFFDVKYTPDFGLDGKVNGLFATISDITERKLAEKQLIEAHDILENRINERTGELKEANKKLTAEVIERKRSEERFDMAVKGSTDGLWDWTDMEKGDVWWSPRFYELLGYENMEFETSFSKFVCFLHPEDKDLVDEAVRAHLEDRVPYDIEYRLKIKSGEYRWFRARGQADWDETGKPQRMSGSVQDIDDRRKAEDLIVKKTVQLKKTHQLLLHSEKLSAIGRLSASIAHEFNNPLYGIQNVLEEVRDGVTLNSGYEELVNIGIKECRRMADLIRKLNVFHRPSSGVSAFIDVNRAIDEIIVLVRKKLQERHIELKLNYANSLPMIPAVLDQFKQVILNVIQNAEHSIPQQGGQISIATEISNSFVKIHIQDTGSGIEAENIKNIFEPFFSTKAEVKGTGLGLFISRGIIQAHGGDITVDSVPGKGTAVTLTLPIKEKGKEHEA